MNKKQFNRVFSIKKIILIILCIIWGLVIFTFSNSDAESSNNISKGLINEVIEVFSNIFDINDKEIEELTISLNRPVRKLAHMTEYFILALLIFNALRIFKYKGNKYILTLIICFIYSIFDEYHQTFISGRTGQFIDCIIDITGSSLYLISVYGISNDKKVKNKNK